MNRRELLTAAITGAALIAAPAAAAPAAAPEAAIGLRAVARAVAVSPLQRFERGIWWSIPWESIAVGDVLRIGNPVTITWGTPWRALSAYDPEINGCAAEPA